MTCVAGAMAAWAPSYLRQQALKHCPSYTDPSDGGLGVRYCTEYYDGGEISPETTDSDLARLRWIPDLKHLIITDSDRVTDAGLVPLEKLRELHSLTLSSQGITDSGIQSLRHLGKLQSLNLMTSSSDAAMHHLQGLPLTWLRITSENLTDQGLETIGKNSTLESLDVFYSSITGSGFRHLAQLPRLTTLNAAKTKVHDAGLADLRRLTRLEHLDLSDTLVTDAAVPHLTSLPTMKTLRLIDTAVTQQGYQELQRALPRCEIFWRYRHKEHSPSGDGSKGTANRAELFQP